MWGCCHSVTWRFLPSVIANTEYRHGCRTKFFKKERSNLEWPGDEGFTFNVGRRENSVRIGQFNKKHPCIFFNYKNNGWLGGIFVRHRNVDRELKLLKETINAKNSNKLSGNGRMVDLVDVTRCCACMSIFVEGKNPNWGNSFSSVNRCN